MAPGWFVVVNEICQRLPVHQALMPSADHQRQEEKVVHNSPLRGEDHAASRRMDPSFTHRFGGRGNYGFIQYGLFFPSKGR